MTPEQLDGKVDLHKVLKQAFGVESLAASRLIHDGQVQIDGHVVWPQYARGHWTVRQLRGRMLSIPQRGQTRLFDGIP